MTTRSLAAVLAVLSSTPGVLAAQALPSADEVHARYVAALGGRDALAAQGPRYERGRFELPAQGMSGTFEVWAAPPNRQVTRIEVPGLGVITAGYDGQTGWRINPATGPQLLQGRELDQLRQSADLFAVLNPERYITRRETTADTTFEGRRVFKVQVVTVWGEQYHEYYDAASGLLAGSTRRQASGMGELEATSIYEEWRQVAGVRSPARVRLRVLSLEQVLTSDSVAVGGVPDSVFALPPQIRALRP